MLAQIPSFTNTEIQPEQMWSFKKSLFGIILVQVPISDVRKKNGIYFWKKRVAKKSKSDIRDYVLNHLGHYADDQHFTIPFLRIMKNAAKHIIENLFLLIKSLFLIIGTILSIPFIPFVALQQWADGVAISRLMKQRELDNYEKDTNINTVHSND